MSNMGYHVNTQTIEMNGKRRTIVKANERQVTHYPCPGCGLFLHGQPDHRCDWIEVAWFRAREEDVLITQIINFDTYLHDLIELFQKTDPRLPGEPPLGSYYVGPKGQLSTEISGSSEEHIEDIPEYVQRWISKSSGPHLAILGEYGTGKTSLCRKLAHDLAIEHFRTDGLSRIPVLFNLRDFTKSLSLESLVSSFLDEQCDVQNPKFRLFEAMNDAGVFVLIFDGFDEMAVRVDADTLEANLAEIDRLAVKDKPSVSM